MSATANLDHLFTDDEPRRGGRARCVVCGAPRVYRIQATVAKLSNRAKPVQGKMRSVSVTVCDQHACKVWDRVAAALAGNK